LGLIRLEFRVEDDRIGVMQGRLADRPAENKAKLLDKAALSYRQAGKTDEADRLSRELRERYPNYAAGG